MLANTLGTEFGKVIHGEMGLKRGASRALYIYTFGFMIPAVVSELIVRIMAGEGLDADDDDQYMDDILSIFFGSQWRTATAMFPFIGPAVNAGVNVWNDKPYDDRISTSPAINSLESVSRTVSGKSFYEIAREDGKRSQGIKDIFTTIGIFTGVPVAPLAKPVGYLSDVAQGEAEPTGPVDFTRGLVTGRRGNN